MSEPKRYAVLAHNARNAPDEDTARKLAMNILQIAVIRSSPTISDVALKSELSGLLRQAYEVAAQNEPHRLFAAGALMGAERALAARSGPNDSPITRLFREVVVQGLDIMMAKNLSQVCGQLEYAVKLAVALEAV